MVESIEVLNYRQANILEDLIQEPEKIFTIQEIVETYKVAYQTARTDLLKLVSLGYVSMKQVSKKYLFVYNPDNSK